jgi:hypothetical protein
VRPKTKRTRRVSLNQWLNGSAELISCAVPDRSASRPGPLDRAERSAPRRWLAFFDFRFDSTPTVFAIGTGFRRSLAERRAGG